MGRAEECHRARQLAAQRRGPASGKNGAHDAADLGQAMRPIQPLIVICRLLPLERTSV